MTPHRWKVAALPLAAKAREQREEQRCWEGDGEARLPMAPAIVGGRGFRGAWISLAEAVSGGLLFL